MDIVQKITSILVNISTLSSRRSMRKKHLSQISPRIFTAAAIIYLFTKLLPYWNILAYFSRDPLPTFNNILSTLLRTYITFIILGWLAYHFIISDILCKLLLHKGHNYDTLPMQLFFTVSDIVDLCSSVFLFLYSLNELLYFANYGSILSENRISFYFFLIYFVWHIALHSFSSNSFHSDNTEKQRSDYFDSNHKRIADGDCVLYCNKYYIVVAPTKSSEEWSIKRKISNTAYTVRLLKEILDDTVNPTTIVESSDSSS